MAEKKIAVAKTVPDVPAFAAGFKLATNEQKLYFWVQRVGKRKRVPQEVCHLIMRFVTRRTPFNPRFRNFPLPYVPALLSLTAGRYYTVMVTRHRAPPRKNHAYRGRGPSIMRYFGPVYTLECFELVPLEQQGGLDVAIGGRIQRSVYKETRSCITDSNFWNAEGLYKQHYDSQVMAFPASRKLTYAAVFACAWKKLSTAQKSGVAATALALKSEWGGKMGGKAYADGRELVTTSDLWEEYHLGRIVFDGEVLERDGEDEDAGAG